MRAAFDVKVKSWQQKINAEAGTDFEVNLKKARKTSQPAPPSATMEDAVLRRAEAKKMKRPLSSYGVNEPVMVLLLILILSAWQSHIVLPCSYKLDP